jgi:hypothetical protein
MLLLCLKLIAFLDQSPPTNNRISLITKLQRTFFVRTPFLALKFECSLHEKPQIMGLALKAARYEREARI